MIPSDYDIAIDTSVDLDIEVGFEFGTDTEIEGPSFTVPEVVATIDTGIPGPPGPSGPTGADGSVWVVEPGPPSPEAIDEMRSGDVYLDSLSGNVYQIDDAGDAVPQGSIIGPSGPVGPSGPPGAAGGVYTHIQDIPATVWVVDHNLGFTPQISCVNPDNAVILGQIHHDVDQNRSTVTFSAPVSGSAHCS